MNFTEPLEACLSFLLGKAYARVQAEFKAQLAPYGVTPAQYAVLKLLWTGRVHNAAALVERLMLDPATVSGLLDRLEASGLLRRESDPQDRRAHRVVLTDEGRRLQPALEAVQTGMNRELLAMFSAGDGAQLKRQLALLGGVTPVETP